MSRKDEYAKPFTRKEARIERLFSTIILIVGAALLSIKFANMANGMRVGILFAGFIFTAYGTAGLAAMYGK